MDFWGKVMPVTVGLFEMIASRERVIFSHLALLIAYLLANGIQWYRKFRRVKKFCRQYTTLNLFDFFNPENDNHVKQRFVSSFGVSNLRIVHLE